MLFVDVVVCLERDLEAGNYVEGFVIVAFLVNVRNGYRTQNERSPPVCPKFMCEQLPPLWPR